MVGAQEVRPAIRLARTGFEHALEFLAILGVLCIALALYREWFLLPAQVPTHYGMDGLPDHFGPKSAMLIVPCISLAMYLGCTVLSRFPWKFNYVWPITEENASRQYFIARVMLLELKTILVWLFAYVTWKEIQVATGAARGIGFGFLPITILLIFSLFALGLRKSYLAR